MYVSMYVCMYLSIYRSMYTRMYVCMYLCMHACMFTYGKHAAHRHTSRGQDLKITKGFRSPNGVGLKSPRLKEAKSNQEITKKITKGFRARL